MDRSGFSSQIDLEGLSGLTLSCDHLGALAAAVRALEPDVKILAERVQMALLSFEVSFSEESAYDDFDLLWVSTGAAALYDATIELVETLMAAVEPLSA